MCSPIFRSTCWIPTATPPSVGAFNQVMPPSENCTSVWKNARQNSTSRSGCSLLTMTVVMRGEGMAHSLARAD